MNALCNSFFLFSFVLLNVDVHKLKCGRTQDRKRRYKLKRLFDIA
jgi:hypothetical protein